MYLSKLEVDIRHPGARQCIRNCQDMHRTLMKAFQSDYSDTARRDVDMLYRVYPNKKTTLVYVLSGEKPDWKKCSNSGLRLYGIKDITKLEDNLKEDMLMTFDIAVVPSKKKRREGMKNSSRVTIDNSEERLEWLKTRGTKNGFAVKWAREDGDIKVFGSHSVDKGGAMCHRGVRFTGVLQVTNVNDFISGFKTGIGPAKAYGFGLLMISRAV